jgi:hypothetical protein
LLWIFFTSFWHCYSDTGFVSFTPFALGEWWKGLMKSTSLPGISTTDLAPDWMTVKTSSQGTGFMAASSLFTR